MYPHEKQNLVSYRAMASAGVFLFAFAIVAGVLFHRFLGLWLAGLTLVCAIPILMAFFRWNSEPTARRQYGELLVLMLAYGFIAAYGVDVLTLKYYSWRGECPSWLWVRFYCGRS